MLRFVLTVLGLAVATAGAAILSDIAGLPVSPGVIGGVVGGVAAVLLVMRFGGKACPRCATELPRTRKPNSLKQALWGGWTCPKCGCEVDGRGFAAS
jgi:hypothetical protein